MLDNPETTTKLLAERPMGSFKCGHAERVLALAGCCAGDHLSGFGRKVRAYARPQQREKGRTLVNEPSEFYDLRRISAHPADGSQSDSRDISAIIIRQWHPNLKSPCENAAERLLQSVRDGKTFSSRGSFRRKRS